MTVLVTGAAGFIGSHLVERLLETTNDSILALDNFNDYYKPDLKRQNVTAFADDPRVTLVEVDVCDGGAVRRLFEMHAIRNVFHLAAYAGVRASVARPELYVKNNVEGTLMLLEAARLHPVDRFVLASSSTVYGKGVEPPFVEDRPLGIPQSPYGATKRAAELLGFTYLSLHDVPVVCVRPFSVYGPRLRPDLALMIFSAAIQEGRPIPLYGDGSVRRDFTHVRDMCDGVLAAMTAKNVVGEAINLGHNEPIEIRKVIAALEKEFGKQANIDYQPARPEDMPMTCADLTKAQRLLGYKPKVDFADGVTQFVEWFRGREAGASS